MIYIYKSGSSLTVISYAAQLTDLEKSKASAVVEVLPVEPEAVPGYRTVLQLDDITKELKYIYVEHKAEIVRLGPVGAQRRNG